MLIAELDDAYPNFLQETPDISDLQQFYKNSKARFDSSPEFKERAHQNVVKLQEGDEHCRAAWSMLCKISRTEFDRIYDRLDINLKEVGESFYNQFLAPMVDELTEKGLAVEDQGAICIFLPKQKVPLMIRKSDGGFNYDTTDMAALRYRVDKIKPDRIVYVTDIGQEFHFKSIFKGALKCQFYDPEKTQLDHMGFGLI